MRGHILTMWFNNRLLRYILYLFPSYIYIYIFNLSVLQFTDPLFSYVQFDVKPRDWVLKFSHCYLKVLESGLILRRFSFCQVYF